MSSSVGLSASPTSLATLLVAISLTVRSKKSLLLGRNSIHAFKGRLDWLKRGMPMEVRDAQVG
jgi:hypothetical protein